MISGRQQRKKSRKKNAVLSEGSEWSFDLINTYYEEIARVAEHYKLDTYPNQIEIITAEQMMEAYSMTGMPIGYSHWSYGKQLVSIEQQYKRGMMGLAYEIVINSNPCIAYLMEENTMMMQALVIAHASFGHNSFFKGNYLFRTWTNADAIIDYLLFAKNYIHQCEERHGVEAVERTLDACHALMNYGVDRYKRPPKLSVSEESRRQEERQAYLQTQVNDLWRTIPKNENLQEKEDEEHIFPKEPEENILYFIEKKAPLLEPWQREIVRIVRKIGQYFYPQKQTKVMNEGWASFWHYTILNHMYDNGLLPDGFMFEFLQSHCSVVFQPDFDSPYYSGINPYALGFAMFSDLKRMSTQPTEEDKRWFPEYVNKPWLENLDFAMRHFKDESFIAQYLSPKLIRDFKFFSIFNDAEESEYHVHAIHDDSGYQRVREMLSQQYDLSCLEPNIQIYRVNQRGDRSLTLRHTLHKGIPLGKHTQEVLKHIHFLWGFDVILETCTPEGSVVSTLRHP